MMAMASTQKKWVPQSVVRNRADFFLRYILNWLAREHNELISLLTGRAGNYCSVQIVVMSTVKTGMSSLIDSRFLRPKY